MGLRAAGCRLIGFLRGSHTDHSAENRGRARKPLSLVHNCTSHVGTVEAAIHVPSSGDMAHLTCTPAGRAQFSSGPDLRLDATLRYRGLQLGTAVVGAVLG